MFLFMLLLILSNNGGCLQANAAIVDIAVNSYTIVNRNTGLYLNAYANAGAANTSTKLTASYGDGTSEQKWQVESLGDNKYYIRSKSNSNLYCINIYSPNNVVSNGSYLHLYNANTYPSKHWYFDSVGDGYYVIRNVQDRNLVIAPVSNAVRASIVAQTYNGGTLQQWKLNNLDNSNVMPTGIKLNETAISIIVGQMVMLTATVIPDNANNKIVTWSSSNNTVATVSSSGVVTGAAAGSAVIYAKTSNGKSAECKVNVASAEYPSTYYWKLPWSKDQRAQFTGGYGKSDAGTKGAHFTTRMSIYTDSDHKRSIAIDFASNTSNFKIYAPTSGTVTVPGYNSDYGNHIMLKTDDGYTVYMAHLRDRPLVSSGQRVTKDTLIGYMGNTGNSTGQHLHFEIRGVLPYVASGSDYTPLTYLFGKPIRTWAYSFQTSSDWYYGQI